MHNPGGGRHEMCIRDRASIVDNGVAKSNLPYILNTGVLMLGNVI